MRFSPKLLLSLVLLVALSACKQDPKAQLAIVNNPKYLREAVHELTDIQVHDIFSPPVASRIYAYASIAAYEAMRQGHPEYATLAGKLHGLTEVPALDTTREVLAPIAGLHAFYQVGKALVFSVEEFQAKEDSLMDMFKSQGVPASVIEASKAYGDQVAKHILAWSSKDNYAQTRSAPLYTVTEDPGTWIPTPPAYIPGIEPSWRDIRTFVVDSAQQFRPLPPTPFSSEKGSPFWNECKQVFDIRNTLTEEQRAIASFWDCNPYVMHQEGHVMYATKKVTPGGHWMGIACQAANKSGADMVETAEILANTSVALVDGFISCWDEKYRSNLIRPESYINKYMDPEWLPLLQTPPFPEYTSGHSVISSAAAVMLTSMLGDNFAFSDSVEMEYGLPVRSFTSFLQASEEAAVSRLYGGIHYRPAIVEGVKEGRALGQMVVLRLRGEAIAVPAYEPKF